MSRKLRKIVVLTLALVLFASFTLNVSAVSLKDYFDAKYYASLYPDLQAAYGNDEAALYNHYLAFGIKEGRIASRVFNVNKYRDMYADLDAAFGDDWDAYANHYATFGIKEGRDGGGDGSNGITAYADQYDDIYAAYGAGLFAALEEYDTLGKTQDRQELVKPYYKARKAMTVDQQNASVRAKVDSQFELAEKALGHVSYYYIAYLNASDADLKNSFAHLYNSNYQEYVQFRDYVLLNGTKEDCDKWYDTYHATTGEHGVSKGHVLPEVVAAD